jgi:hypothetical protein
MAIDNTPPRLKLIVTIAVITVVTLISLDFVFKSYYAMMSTQAQREKVAPTHDKTELRKAEAAAFANAAVPMDQVIAQLAKGARPEAITPQPSEDLAPMTGWSKLPKPAPSPQPKGQIPEPGVVGDGGASLGAGAAALAGDAGVQAGGDAGARPAGGADAGTARPAPTPHH